MGHPVIWFGLNSCSVTPVTVHRVVFGHGSDTVQAWSPSVVVVSAVAVAAVVVAAVVVVVVTTPEQGGAESQGGAT